MSRVYAHKAPGCVEALLQEALDQRREGDLRRHIVMRMCSFDMTRIRNAAARDDVQPGFLHVLLARLHLGAWLCR